MSRSASTTISNPTRAQQLILVCVAFFLAAWLVRENAAATYPRHQKIEVPIMSFHPPRPVSGARSDEWAPGEATVEFVNEGRVDRRKISISYGDLVAGRPAESLTGPKDVPKGTMIELFQRTDDPWQLSTSLDRVEPEPQSDTLLAATGWVMGLSSLFGSVFLVVLLRALFRGAI